MAVGTRRNAKALRLLTATALLACCGACAGTAEAAPLTLGSPLEGTVEPGFVGSAGTVLNTALPEPGAVLISPVSGAIVRWRVRAATGTFKLRVLTPGTAGLYTAAGTSGEASPTTVATETFPASLPIQAGQTIGLDAIAGSIIGLTKPPGAVYGVYVPPLKDGEAKPIAPGNVRELQFNADVQPVPTIKTVTPSSASITTAPLTVEGTDFADVKSVEFDGHPVSSYKVESEGTITFSSPGSIEPKVADIVVTTIAGKSAPAQFTYLACKVPNLKGKSVRAARKVLVKKRCALGKVKKAKGAGRHAKVKRQSRKAGIFLPVGKKIDIRVG